MNNDSVNCDVKSLCDNQSIEGQFVSTWADRNVSRLYNVLIFNGNINDQYCDFTMSGKGCFCLYEENAANGSIQKEYFSEVCDHVRCDFISILEYVDTNECWLVYLHGNDTLKMGFIRYL